MIESREHLIHVLTEAAEIEHNLLCSYLYAVFSLKRRGEPGLSEFQGEAVERWRRSILTVALEEMSHLACVNNLLVAVGGAPHLDRPNLPVAPGYHPAEIVVRLTPFDGPTLDHFIFLERADASPVLDGEGFEPGGWERATQPGRLTSSSMDYKTVGALYDALGQGFRDVAAALGEDVLIDGEGRGQLDGETAGLADVHVVRDLASALAVIDHVKEQGEGSTGGHGDSHFERFQAIRSEWAELVRLDPEFRPAWPAAHDPVMRKPAPEAVRVWVDDPEAAAHLDLGNAVYGAMLGMLNQAFGLEDRAEQAALLGAATELMEAGATVGQALARMPASAAHPGVNAGLTFAVPRSLGRRPHDARARFAERARELRLGAERILSGEAQAKAVRRLSNAVERLTGDVPTSMASRPAIRRSHP